MRRTHAGRRCSQDGGRRWRTADGGVDQTAAESTRRRARAKRTQTVGPGLEFPRFFSTAGIDPFDQVEWELRDAVIGSEKGSVVFEQRQVEMPKPWSQQATNIVVSKYFRGHVGSPERERSVKQLIGRVVDTITAWAQQAELLRVRRGAVGVQRRSEAPARRAEGRLQQPGVVQLRLREGAAVLGLLHQLRRRHDGVDPHAGQDRGHALQVRLRHGQQPVGDPLVEGAAGRRRHGLGSGVVHEGLRRVRRRHQVGRQDAPRGEDGHPQRRASGHRRVHQLQGRRREEGVGADRRRLRRLVHRHGVRVGVLPELEQLRARRPTSSCARCWTTGCGRRGR